MENYLKKIISLSALMLIFWMPGFNLAAQQPTFQKIYIGFPGETIFRDFDFLQTLDSGFVMGGAQRMIKCDKNGSLQWIKECYNPSQSFVSYVKSTSSYFTAGMNLVLKLDSSLNIEWGQNILINGFNNVHILKIEPFDSTKFIFGGRYITGSRAYLFFMCMDSQGAVEWTKAFWLSTTAADRVGTLAITPDKGIIICGRTDSVNAPFVSSDGLVFKMDSLGTFQWGKRFSSPTQNFNFEDLAVTNDSGFALIGKTLQHRIILKLDSSGNTLWMKYYESGIDGDGYSIDETSDGGLIATGLISGVDSFGFYERPLLFKTDNQGNVIWAHIYNNYGYCRPSCVNETFDSGFAISIETNNPGGGTSFGMIKTDSMGFTNGCSITDPILNVSNLNFIGSDVAMNDSSLSIITTVSSYSAPNIGSEITLCSSSGIMEENSQLDINIYPNPNNGNFSITFKNNMTGELEIFDFFGRVLFKQAIISNHLDVKFPFDLKRGIYNLKVTAKNNLHHSKIVIQ